MRYWVFHEAALDAELARHEAERQRAGASEQQARDETVAIKTFLWGSRALRADAEGGA